MQSSAGTIVPANMLASAMDGIQDSNSLIAMGSPLSWRTIPHVAG
jgi:hypothetical protein